MSEPDRSSDLLVTDFDFELPEELIAQQPPAQRGQSRMLVMDRATGAFVSNVYRQINKFPLPREEELQEAPMSPVPIRLKNAHLGADRRSALPSPDPR